MFCPQCGTNLEDGVLYCSSCGKPLGSEPDTGSETQKKPRNHAKRFAVVGVVVALAVSAIATIVIFGVPGTATQESATDYEYVNNWVHYCDGTVKDGDWLYFVPRSAEYSEQFSVSSLWRARSNGEDAQEIYVPETHNEDEGVILGALAFAGGRIYFTETHYRSDESSPVSAFASVNPDGSDLRIEAPLTSRSQGAQVVGDTIYFSNENALFSRSLNSDERTRVARLKDGSGSWVVADGYVYDSSYKDERFSIIRTSLKDGSEETVYSSYGSSGTYVTPFNGFLYFERHTTESGGDISMDEIVRFDPETGDEEVVYELPSSGSQYFNSWAITEKGLFVIVEERNQATQVHRVSLDGSSDEAIFTYDGSWAGNPLTKRNVGGSDKVSFEGFCVVDGDFYFWPVDLAAAVDLYEDDDDKPIYTSLCRLSSDGSDFSCLVTSDNKDSSNTTQNS